MSDFVIWRHARVDGACTLKALTGLERTFRLNDGTPLAADFPRDVAFHFDPDFPDDVLLPDNVLNIDMVLVVSPRLRDVVAAERPAELELLPVTIVDHGGAVVSRDYTILHPTRPVDALDRERSAYEPSLIDPDQIAEITRLVVDETKVPPDRSFFRIQGFWEATLVRRSLAETILRAQPSGLRFIELSAWPE